MSESRRRSSPSPVLYVWPTNKRKEKKDFSTLGITINRPAPWHQGLPLPYWIVAPPSDFFINFKIKHNFMSIGFSIQPKVRQYSISKGPSIKDVFLRGPKKSGPSLWANQNCMS